MLESIPVELEFLATDPGQYQDLDAGELQRYTGELESLGFKHALDFQVKTEVPSTGEGFARLFIHAKDHCFAEVNQLFPFGGEPIPMRCSLFSLIENGWSLSHTDRKAEAVTYMLRRKKALWVSRPNASTTELFEEHKEKRQQIALALNLPIREKLTTEDYYAHEREDAINRKVVMKRRYTCWTLICSLWASVLVSDSSMTHLRR